MMYSLRSKWITTFLICHEQSTDVLRVIQLWPLQAFDSNVLAGSEDALSALLIEFLLPLGIQYSYVVEHNEIQSMRVQFIIWQSSSQWQTASHAYIAPPIHNI